MASRIRDSAGGSLYEVFCVVSPGNQQTEGHIVKKYPEAYDNEEKLKNIPNFAFPCPLENSYVQHYSFVLTSADRKFTFGFCRYDPKSNTTLLLLSHLPWHDIFYKLLNSIASLISKGDHRELRIFLEASRLKPPSPGQTLNISYNGGRNTFTCQRPTSNLATIPDNVNLTEYFSALDSKCMIGLWAAMLHERRIALVASKPSRLSACVQAANALLFPMSWQHIFIPILPKHLVDYLLAPMPFLIGVPRSVLEAVRMSDLGEVVILDIDSNELKTPFKDQESLPRDLVANLKETLDTDNALGDVVARSFLRTLVGMFGGYREAMSIENGQRIKFNADLFVNTRKAMKPFLGKMLESQIFQQFIDERLDLLNSGRGIHDEFEVECNIYSAGEGSAQNFKTQYRNWIKNMKKEGGAFFKNVKDKMRQGGKNVRSAVRGLNKAKNEMTSSHLGTGESSSTLSASPRSCRPTPPNHIRTRPFSGDPIDVADEVNCHPQGSISNSNSSHSLSNDNVPLSQLLPPRIRARPPTPERYPIARTMRLVDTSDAPMPPPRSGPSRPAGGIVRTITRSEQTQPSAFRTSTIRLGDNDEAVVNLSLPRPVQNHRAEPQSNAPRLRTVMESCFSGVDLIKLDVSPSAVSLEDFDPLKHRGKNEKIDEHLHSSTDSALLHEYGLDFSQFSFNNFSSTSSADQEASSGVPKGWTTFN
ncbi:unnamed protein product [Leptosia nina]|uniref:UDENN domain-containing protein n=1 Tax=Leptosia nina TaxID=320188 RepID=A0AAV1JY31_9NEOP